MWAPAAQEAVGAVSGAIRVRRSVGPVGETASESALVSQLRDGPVPGSDIRRVGRVDTSRSGGAAGRAAPDSRSVGRWPRSPLHRTRHRHGRGAGRSTFARVSKLVRRVVTGHDDQGRAVFASDEHVAPIEPALTPGTSFHVLWGADAAPRFPDRGERPPTGAYFPPLGGFRFAFFTIPPDGERRPPADDVDLDAAAAAFEELLPGLAGHMEPDAPGMHTTATIDFEVVLSGTPSLELDDGATVTLAPGDTVVQNGTRHRWGNPGSEPATLAVVLIGAHHRSVG